jgi:hypothetical protein
VGGTGIDLPAELSGGQQQRVAMARALVKPEGRPELAEKAVLVDVVERCRQVGVEDPHPLGPGAVAGGVDRLDRVAAAAAGPESIGSGLEPCLPLRLQRVSAINRGMRLEAIAARSATRKWR